jgi:hypothetical protein
LKNQGKILNIDSDAEVVFATDLIYLRYALAFAYLKSVRSDTSNIRKVIHEISVYNDLVKKVVDRILAATLRIFKLRKAEQYVFAGLYDSIRIYELNHNTLHALDGLCRLNLSSILVIKTFGSGLSPDKVGFLAPLAKRTMNSIDELRKLLNTPFNDIFVSLIDFLEISAVFYRCLTLYAIFRLNLFENDGLIKRNKDYKSILVENHIIAKEIFARLDDLKKRQFKSKDSFNVEENRRFCSVFFEKFAFSYLEE